MNENPNFNDVLEFLEAFEQVFHEDWSYTKEMLGIHHGAPRFYLTEEGMEEFPIIAEGATFAQPNVEDEVEDWGNRARLLEAYRALRKAVDEVLESRKRNDGSSASDKA